MLYTPPMALICQGGILNHRWREASMGEVSVIGLDLAKHVFQVHGADASGQVVIRKQLRRHQVLEFFAWLHVDFEPHLEGFYRGCGFTPTPAGLIRLT
jgi:hypothetical protein